MTNNNNTFIIKDLTNEQKECFLGMPLYSLGNQSQQNLKRNPSILRRESIYSTQLEASNEIQHSSIGGIDPMQPSRQSSILPPSNPNIFRKIKTVLKNHTIPIGSKWRSVWDIFIIPFIFYSTLKTAYYVAFDFQDFDDIGTFLVQLLVEIVFCIDIVIRFFSEYQDYRTYEVVNDIGKIAKHYLKTWFLFDFLSVIPIGLIQTNSYGLKLFRIVRIPRLFKLQPRRIFYVMEILFPFHMRHKKLINIQGLKYLIKVIRLFLMGALLTYFLGCFWYYLISQITRYSDPFETDTNPPENFYDKYHFSNYSDGRRLIICCYYALATLSTIGYGDYTPQTNLERITTIIFMLLGVVCFSYVYSNLNDMFFNYDREMGLVNKSDELHAWLLNCMKLSHGQTFSYSLIKDITKHFKYLWSKHSLASIHRDDKYLKSMPKKLKYSFIIAQMEDIYSLFRGFFLYHEIKNDEFFYEIAFEIIPVNYSENTVIIRQGESFNDIFFLINGYVEVYFEYNGKKVSKIFNRGFFFGAANVLLNTKAEFNYATKKIKKSYSAQFYVIHKSKLIKYLKKYPKIYERYVENSRNAAQALFNSLKHEFKLLVNSEKESKHENPLSFKAVSGIFLNKILINNDNLQKSKPKKSNTKREMYDYQNYLSDLKDDVKDCFKRIEGIRKDLNIYVDYVIDKLGEAKECLANKYGIS